MSVEQFLDARTALVAVGVTVLVIALNLFYHAAFTKATGKDLRELTRHYHPFANPYTNTVLMVCVGLMAAGLLMMSYFESAWGILVGSAGGLLWWKGMKKIPSNPRHAGILQISGVPVLWKGSPVLVGGDTIVLPFWPFEFDVILIKTVTEDFEIEDVIIYAGGVPLPGTISVQLAPDLDRPLEYLQAGGDIEKIRKQADNIIINQTRHVVTELELSPEKVVMDPLVLTEEFSDKLTGRLMDKFSAKNLGVKVRSIQWTFDMPDSVEEDMIAYIKEIYQRKAERADYATNAQAAEDLLKKYRDNGDDSKTFDDCLKQVIFFRLVREGKVVNTGGKLTITDFNINDEVSTNPSGNKKK